MKFRVRHRITYTYERPVFVEPLTIRLRPRCDSSQTVHRYSLSLTPSSADRSDFVNVYGNDIVLVWFQDVQNHVEITTDWDVTTLRANPFEFLITDSAALKIPFAYPDSEQAVLPPYLWRTQSDPSVDDFARDVLRGVQSTTVPFLGALSGRIHETCRSVIRHEGGSLPPAETLAQRQGACRDLAVLFVDACRSVGLAARFVSGYKSVSEDDDQRHLHAWAEVYLPGAGWRGWDPSLGLAVADAHVVVAAAPEPTSAAPTTGSFRGSGIGSRLDFAVEIDVAS